MRHSRGFTLIEVLIALAVFAIIATISASTIYYAFTMRARVSEVAQRLLDIQLAITIMERDSKQAISRPVRANEMRLYSAFMGQAQYVEFTRAGIPNPGSFEKRSTLQRIAFLCRDKQLIKRRWLSLDVRDRNQYKDRTLLRNLQSCQFKFLDQNLQLLSEWRENANADTKNGETFPKALQFSLAIKSWGKGEFLFLIPGAVYVKL